MQDQYHSEVLHKSRNKHINVAGSNKLCVTTEQEKYAPRAVEVR